MYTWSQLFLKLIWKGLPIQYKLSWLDEAASDRIPTVYQPERAANLPSRPRTSCPRKQSTPYRTWHGMVLSARKKEAWRLWWSIKKNPRLCCHTCKAVNTLKQHSLSENGENGLKIVKTSEAADGLKYLRLVYSIKGSFPPASLSSHLLPLTIGDARDELADLLLLSGPYSLVHFLGVDDRVEVGKVVDWVVVRHRGESCRGRWGEIRSCWECRSGKCFVSLRQTLQFAQTEVLFRYEKCSIYTQKISIFITYYYSNL